jgi:hypothetical protein
MRLEPLCKVEGRYTPNVAWVRPFGGQEAAGFGQGEGQVTGRHLAGSLVWANHPRRREDGVWCPDLHGAITTDDGARILLTLQGYSLELDTPTVRRALVVAVRFAAQHERYRWLNSTLGVAEGEIDEETEAWWVEVYAVVNEVVAAPVKIEGAKPPWG